MQDFDAHQLQNNHPPVCSGRGAGPSMANRILSEAFCALATVVSSSVQQTALVRWIMAGDLSLFNGRSLERRIVISGRHCLAFEAVLVLPPP